MICQGFLPFRIAETASRTGFVGSVNSLMLKVLAVFFRLDAGTVLYRAGL